MMAGRVIKVTRTNNINDYDNIEYALNDHKSNSVRFIICDQFSIRKVTLLQSSSITLQTLQEKYIGKFILFKALGFNDNDLFVHFNLGEYPIHLSTLEVFLMEEFPEIDELAKVLSMIQINSLN